jgi:hypothetical protein
LIAGALGSTFLRAFADHLAGLSALAALADSRRIVAVNEAVLFYSPDGNLDDAIAVFADNGLLGDDVRDVLSDRRAHFLTMAQAVSGAAIAPLSDRGMVGTEDGFHG